MPINNKMLKVDYSASPNYMLSKKFKGCTLSPYSDKIGIGTDVTAFDILKDARELTGIRITAVLRPLDKYK